MDEFVLSKLADNPQVRATYPDVQKLADKIPPSLQGMFFVAFEGTSIGQLRLQPDVAIDAMNALNTQIENDQSTMRHGGNLSLIYKGDELRKLIDTPTDACPLDQRMDNYVRITRHDGTSCDAAEYYGENYAGSYLLEAALANPELSTLDAQRLRTITSNHKKFPAGVQGVFTVDLVRDANNNLSVESFALSPNVATRLLMEGPLKAVVPERVATASNSEYSQIRFHPRGLTMNRDDFGKLATKMSRVEIEGR